MVKTLHFQCRGCRYNPFLGNQNSKSHVAWPIKKKTTSCQTYRKEVLLLDRCQKDMVHQKLQWRLGSAGGQGSPEVSLPYHVRRKPAFIFLSREGITVIQQLIPRETTIAIIKKKKETNSWPPDYTVTKEVYLQAFHSNLHQLFRDSLLYEQATEEYQVWKTSKIEEIKAKTMTKHLLFIQGELREDTAWMKQR